MNLNVWNIKDMFNTPSSMGPHKSSSWTSAATDYNSMSDSQFLFGSQFCPENLQAASTPLEFRPRKSSQQNSQDSEPSIFAKYQSKPQLFSGDEKEKGSLNFPAGRFKSTLEQFEDKKKKIKEKHDSEVLNSFIWNTKENLEKLQSSLDKSEETLKSMLDGLGSLAKTMQETSESHCGLVLSALKDKGEMEQTFLGMKKMLEDNTVEFSDLKSSLRLLKDSLEQLIQQNQQHLKLCEQLGHLQLPTLLADLQAFISAPRAPRHIKDSASQTSPDILSSNHSPISPLNAPSRSKFTSTTGASGHKGNVNKQQKSRILTTGQDDSNTPCTCHSGTAAPEDGREGCWLLTQEPCQATPVRKVIKRDKQTKGLSAGRRSPLTCSHADNGLMQTHTQNHKKLSAVHKVQNKSIGSRVRKGRSQKCNQRKRQCSFRKEGQNSKCKDTHLKQKDARKEYAESEGPQRSYRDSVNPENTSIISQQNPPWVQNRKAEKSKLLLQRLENMPSVPNQQEMSGVKKIVDISSTKNNSFWVCSSPESSLSQNQMRWFSLSENLSPICATSTLQKMTTRCPLFFDSDYSD